MRYFLAVLFGASIVGAVALNGTLDVASIVKGCVGALILSLFFLPSLIAFHRRMPFRWSLLWINAASGWTVVIWMLTLVEVMRFAKENQKVS